MEVGALADTVWIRLRVRAGKAGQNFFSATILSFQKFFDLHQGWEPKTKGGGPWSALAAQRRTAVGLVFGELSLLTFFLWQRKKVRSVPVGK